MSNFAIIFAVLLASCLAQKKEDADPSVNSFDLDFNANPYAVAGRLHNQYLACLRKITVKNPSETLKALSGICNFDHSTVNSDLSQFINRYSRLAQYVLKASSINGALKLANIFLSEEHISFIQALDDVLSDKNSPQQAVRQLIDLEAKAVLAFGSSESPENTSLYCGLSIARASLHYWLQDFLEVEPVPNRDNADRPKRAKPKWWQVVAADCAGGIVGGIFGGGVGAVGLGTACSKIVADLE
eukprot:gene11276-3316_t